MLERLSRFFGYAWGTAALAPSPLGRAWTVVAACWLLARVYVPWLPEWHVRIPVLRRGRRLDVFVGQYQDLEVLREIYLESEYPDDLGIVEPEVIVDLGANVGYTLLDFRLRYPNARLIGLEPDPVAFHTLRLNTAADPNISVLPLAIAGADGLREFYSSSESVVSGFERTRDFQTPITVPTRSLDTLMKELGLARIDLLKIDVEGAEEEVLAAATRLTDVGVVIGELHTPLLTVGIDDFYRRFLGDFVVQTTDERPERATFLARRSPSPAPSTPVAR
jgi:FkbM family methyltransferase